MTKTIRLNCHFHFKKDCMLRLLLAISCFILCETSFGQPTKKPAAKEKAPTQKEMEDMMKDAQKELDGMSPEDKRMMDSMGIKMPSMKNVPKVSDAQMKEAWENETAIVPKRDAARLASISNTPLTESSMPSYISSAHKFVLQRINAASKTMGEKIYTQLKADGKTNALIGNEAAGLWMMGRVEIALCLMGKVCIDAPANADNLNNYASMLSMSGAEQLAIPLLYNLNTRYPKNSTILNNLGQAFFGLGEISKAEKYLDSVIRIYAYHPQANYTKSFIEESKGNTAQAVEAVKRSIKHSYSEDKENRLRKLGYKLNGDDIRFPFKPDSDPLALGSFKHPAFPVTAEQEVGFKPTWAEYRQQLDAKITNLGGRLKQAEQAWNTKLESINKHDMQVVKNAMNNGQPGGNLISVPFFAKKASLKLQQMDKDGGVNFRLTKASKEVALYPIEIAPKKNDYDKDIEKLAEEDNEQTGEGLPNKDFCPKYAERVSKYLNECNPTYEKLYDEYLHQFRLKLGEEIYWMQFMQWPEQFEVSKLAYQINWLTALRDLRYTETGFFNTRILCIKRDENRKVKTTLANFNDINCQYHSVLKLGPGTIRNDCNTMTTTMDIKFLQFGMRQDMDKETFGDQFLGCTVTVGVEHSLAKSDYGPLRIEAKIGAGVEFEFDRGGLKDVSVIAEIKAGAGTNVVDKGGEDAGIATSLGGKDMVETSIDIGVEGRVSLISGKSSVEGTGVLKSSKP
jgi:tetratricopeptide (TPR) repeat protein